MDSDQLRQTRFYNLQDKQRVSENELNFESLFQVKLTHYDKDDQSQVMLQIVDISQTVKLDNKVVENEMLAIINTTVSHEL